MDNMDRAVIACALTLLSNSFDDTSIKIGFGLIVSILILRTIVDVLQEDNDD